MPIRFPLSILGAHEKRCILHNWRFKDITNQKFGYLTAIRVDESRKHSSHTYWVCKCVCGKERSLQLYQLTTGSVTSCGCKNTRRKKSELIAQNKRIYGVYSSMLARCYNPKSISYRYYGGRGITVCDEWKNDFKAFVDWAQNNRYNDSLSIDRIDNSKGYCPENCRWVTLLDQSKNKSTSVSYTHNGETHNLKEWCQILGFNYDLAKSRRKIAKRKNIEPSFEYVFAPPKFKKSV